MRALCCRGTENEKNEITVVEAIELVHERMRDVGVQVAQAENRMMEESVLVRRAVQKKDMDDARLHMKRIRSIRERRLRHMQCREKLWLMKETLEEQASYALVQESFSEGLRVTDELLKKVDLGQVEDMMERFEESVIQTREIGEELGRDTHLDGADADREIERELAVIMGGLEKEVELPTIPDQLKVVPKNGDVQQKAALCEG